MGYSKNFSELIRQPIEAEGKNPQRSFDANLEVHPSAANLSQIFTFIVMVDSGKIS